MAIKSQTRGGRGNPNKEGPPSILGRRRETVSGDAQARHRVPTIVVTTQRPQIGVPQRPQLRPVSMVGCVAQLSMVNAMPREERLLVVELGPTKWRENRLLRDSQVKVRETGPRGHREWSVWRLIEFGEE